MPVKESERKEYKNNYYLENREKINAQNLAYYYSNKEARLKYRHEKYMNDYQLRMRLKEYSHNYYAEHKQVLLARMRMGREQIMGARANLAQKEEDNTRRKYLCS